MYEELDGYFLQLNKLVLRPQQDVEVYRILALFDELMSVLCSMTNCLWIWWVFVFAGESFVCLSGQMKDSHFDT